MIVKDLQICQILISNFRYVKNIFGDTKDVADWDNGGIQARKLSKNVRCIALPLLPFLSSFSSSLQSKEHFWFTVYGS